MDTHVLLHIFICQSIHDERQLQFLSQGSKDSPSSAYAQKSLLSFLNEICPFVLLVPALGCLLLSFSPTEE